MNNAEIVLNNCGYMYSYVYGTL